MTKLTKRQHEILTLIQSHMAKTGSPPTRAEIAKTMGFRSPNAAEDHLRALARKGVIELVPGTSRGIRLASTMTGIPIVKMEHLTINEPLLSEHHIEGNTQLNRALFQTPIDFLIHLSQKSMPELGFLEGDYLAVHQTKEIRTGHIAVLRVNHELAIRRYSEDFKQQNPTIEGQVVGVIRSLTKTPLS